MADILSPFQISALTLMSTAPLKVLQHAFLLDVHRIHALDVEQTSLIRDALPFRMPDLTIVLYLLGFSGSDVRALRKLGATRAQSRSVAVCRCAKGRQRWVMVGVPCMSFACHLP